MSECSCWRCRAGVGPCANAGVGAFEAVRSRSALVPPTRGKAKAASFDSLVRPVSHGPLARRVDPAKASLAGVVSGVGALDSLLSSAGSLGVKQGAPRGAMAAAAAGAVAGATYGSFVPILGTAVGGAIGGAVGLVGGALGLFGDDSAQRRAKNLALYAGSWTQAKVIVADEITRLQRRLDLLDRDLIALDATLSGLDGTIRATGAPPQSVTGALASAKAKRVAAGDVIDTLRATEDDLNAKAATVAQGEASGQTGPGSEAQRALEAARDLTQGVDQQVTTTARSLSVAVNAARAATTSVNRWVDQTNAQAQAAQQAAWQAKLVDSVASQLSPPPPPLTLTGPYTPIYANENDGGCGPEPFAGSAADPATYVMEPLEHRRWRECRALREQGPPLATATQRPSWAPPGSLPSLIVPGAYERQPSDPLYRFGMPGANLVYAPGYAGPRVA